MSDILTVFLLNESTLLMYDKNLFNGSQNISDKQ